MKERKPKYNVCNIYTDDINIITESNEIRINGVTHEDIYRKGIEYYKNCGLRKHENIIKNS